MKWGLRLDMWRACWLAGLGVMFGMGTVKVEARVFTDDGGRQVEAELVGVRGGNVVLARQGVAAQWPLAKLSAADQAFVKDWQQQRSAVAKLSVRIFERDGIGERGEFPEEKEAAKSPGPPGLPGPPGSPPNIPGIRETEQKVRYKHYDVDITNPASVDATRLKVDYVLYVMKPDGSVGTGAGSQLLATLAAGQRATVITEGIDFTRTKTTALKLNINASRSGGSVTTSQKTTRDAERFGGAWVRVRGVDGSLLGEARSLHPDLERLDPPWVGAKETEVEELPVLKALGDFLDLLKEKLPKPPGGSPAEKGGVVPPPPFPPKP